MRYKVFNGHSDYAFKVFHEQRMGNTSDLKDNYLPLMKKGGVQVEVFQVGGDFTIPHAGIDGRDTLTCLQILESNLAQIRANPDEFYLITDGDQLRTAKDDARRGFIFSMEGASALAQGPQMLSVFYELGLRSVALTHNPRNVFADGCAELESNGGLSKAGRDLVKKINELNMMLDLVHINSRSFFQALDLYEHIPIVSHSNAYALYDHFRNLSDGQIRAIGERGGVVGVNFIAAFMMKNARSATPDDVVDIIEHIAGLIGTDHVGIGPDFIEYFTNMLPYVKGMEDPTGIPLLAEALERRGYSTTDINKILFDNFARVFSQVLKGANNV